MEVSTGLQRRNWRRDPAFGAAGELLFALAPGVAAGAGNFQLLNSGAMIVILQNTPGATPLPME